MVIGAQNFIYEFLITSEKGLTNFTDIAEVAPVKEIVNRFIALTSQEDVRGPEVRLRPRGDVDDETKAVFAPVDGVWSRNGPGHVAGA